MFWVLGHGHILWEPIIQSITVPQILRLIVKVLSAWYVGSVL